ncbi:MAG: DUF4982 domain-containing protein, partial [Candidatus Cryptobacteroides sp.]
YWSNIPDLDFAADEDFPWCIGQFIWTGFDYLGEPSPYDTDAWPNHSSMFGIIDLASLPKDRFYLYRSVWRSEEPTLHILPHWNWDGMEGEKVPVFVYTSYPEAEVFVNGTSFGRRHKRANAEVAEERYRLMWDNVIYTPGEVKVVAYGNDGQAVAEKTIRTATEPHHIELLDGYPPVTTRNGRLDADGKDLAYITVRIVDKDGNLCPLADNEVSFSVSGQGSFRACANGNPASLELFHEKSMHAFNGMMTAIIQTGTRAGSVTLTATSPGLQPSSIRFEVR